MRLITLPYTTQATTWPHQGRHILAKFDAETAAVYQAYRPESGQLAATHGSFGGAFSLNRMSWVKPSFVWMMYRSGWGTNSEQEVTLAVRLQRGAFDALLARAVPSSFDPWRYETEAAWKAAVAAPDVWLPYRSASRPAVTARAITPGLERGQVCYCWGQLARRLAAAPACGSGAVI